MINWLTWYFLASMILAFSPLSQTNQDISALITQIDKSNFPQIKVYLSLIDSSGQPIKAVPASAFSLFENNIPIRTFDIEGNREPISNMLVIDRSGSMAEAGKMDGAKNAAIAYIESFEADDFGGVVVFDTEVNLLQDLTTNHGMLINKIQETFPNGRTAFYDALWIALEKLNPIPGRKSVIALTDGLDNESKHNADEIIEFARKANIPIYAIGLGDKTQAQESEAGLDETLLTKIAEASGGYYVYSPSPGELTALYTLLSEQIQNEYKLSYMSPNSNRDGSNRDVKVNVIQDGKILEVSQLYNPGGVIPVTSFEKNVTNSNASMVSYDTWFFGSLVILLCCLFIPSVTTNSLLFTKDLYFNLTYVHKVKPGSPLIGNNCANEGAWADKYKIKAGDWIVICPRCKATYHLDCWLDDNICNCRCGIPGCLGKGNPWVKYFTI